MLALEGEPLFRHQAVHDLELLLEHVEPGRRIGNGNPCVRCSSSHQPAPMPSSTRPPLTRSTVIAAFANTAGRRNVTGETRVPRRIVVVDAASAPEVRPCVGRPSVVIAVAA